MGSAPAQIDPKLGRSLSSLYDTGLGLRSTELNS
jgi:hypothetical protein